MSTSLKFLFMLLLCCGPVLAQDEESDEPETPKKQSKFLTGFYVGSYFANKYSADAYSGYGFDIDGRRNTFENSFMYQKIINEYGGIYGQTDQIALALGVDPRQWSFNETDMPINMHYLNTILLGLNFKLPLGKRNAIIANFNVCKISVEGNFTMTLLRPPTSPNPGINNNIKTFTIIGKEQRMQFQLGFQRIFGEVEKLNFFGEVGFMGTLAKFDQNRAIINGLDIDLTYYVNQTLYPSPGPTRRPIGFGIGAFAGIGLNIDVNPKFTLQFLYTLSHEKINIGVSPELKLQHAIGMRGYYNF